MFLTRDHWEVIDSMAREGFPYCGDCRWWLNILWSWVTLLNYLWQWVCKCHSNQSRNHGDGPSPPFVTEALHLDNFLHSSPLRWQISGYVPHWSSTKRRVMIQIMTQTGWTLWCSWTHTPPPPPFPLSFPLPGSKYQRQDTIPGLFSSHTLVKLHFVSMQLLVMCDRKVMNMEDNEGEQPLGKFLT